MSLFKKIFEKVIAEDNVAGDGGAFGATGSNGGAYPAGTDFYAPGDARIPNVLGSKPGKRKKKRKVKNRKKSKKKRVSKHEQVHIQRRNLNRSL
jgi:hypothetical protein